MKFTLLAVAASLAAAQSVAGEMNRPVAKVIKMLQHMSEELRQEAKTDEEMYEKLGCWCKTNKAEKEQAVKMATKRMDSASAQAKASLAEANKLAAEIEKAKEDRKKADAALREAQALRDKQASEFYDADKELTESIRQLKGAIEVLKKHNSLVQVPDMGAMLRDQLKKHGDILKALAPQVTALISGPMTTGASYNARSGQIFGILEQMLETFENDQSDETKTENARKEAFAGLKAAKKEEIAALTESINNKEVQKAAAKKAMADADAEFADMSAAREADQKFLRDLEDKCSMTDAEFEKRTKTRNEEIVAVQETINVLNSEEAQALFNRSVNSDRGVGFLQLSAKDMVREKALKALSKFHSAGMMQIKAMVKLDAFTKVKAAIDEMVEQLKLEKKEETKQRDACIANFNENDRETAMATDEANRQTADIERLDAKIEQLTADIKQANADIEEAKKQMQLATINREEENAAFQQVKSDQMATQQVLAMAMERMKNFYNPDVRVEGQIEQVEEGSAKDLMTPDEGVMVGGQLRLMQIGEHHKQEPGAAAPPPPQGFKEYENNSGGMKVIEMIKTIIADSKAAERQATLDENNEQSAYESFAKDTNNAVKNLQKSVNNNEESKSEAEAQREQAQSNLDTEKGELAALADQKGAYHKECDFLMNNFQLRQDMKQQEIEALGQAKAILSGMLNFLQRN